MTNIDPDVAKKLSEQIQANERYTEERINLINLQHENLVKLIKNSYIQKNKLSLIQKIVFSMSSLFILTGLITIIIYLSQLPPHVI